MADYNSISEILDLNAEKLNEAILLEFADYLIIPPWDNRAFKSEDVSTAVDRDFFKFSATQGATYWLTSRSANEPELVLYNATGEAIAIDNNDTSGKTDNILEFIANYTGFYYVDAGWVQSTEDRVVSMIIYEDVDTIGSFQGDDSTDDSPDDSNDDLTDDSPNGSNDDSNNPFDSKSGDNSNDDSPGTSFNGGQLFGEYYFGTDDLDTIDYDGYLVADVEFSQNGPVDDLVAEDWMITYDYNDSKTGNVDKLFDIERAQFDDYSVALDLDVFDSAGSALALIHAAFGSYANADTAGLWINYSDSMYYDNGVGLIVTNDNITDHYVAMAEEMLDHYLPDGVTDELLLSILSQNVLDKPLDSQTSSYFLPLLNNGDLSQAELVAFAAMSDENTSQYIDEIQLAGFVYNPDPDGAIV